MVPALVARIVLDEREGERDLLAGLDLAVEDPQRVGLGLPLAIGAELGLALGRGLAQGGAVGRAAGPAADRIDQGLGPAHAELAEEGMGHLDDLGVDRSVLFAEDLDVDLVELPVTSLLGLVVAEHGPHEVVAHGRALEVEPVLDDGPDDRGRVLGPQGQGPAALVDERVHLFGDDVGGRAGLPFSKSSVASNTGARSSRKP